MQERGRLLIEPLKEIYEGQIVGIHAKDNDLTVNALRAKQLTNFRASGKDDALALTPPVKFSLEQALEFIERRRTGGSHPVSSTGERRSACARSC
jgi:GTP-binding protein